MDRRLEIHTEITKSEAYELMVLGHKIRHQYYDDDEYLCMKNSVIYDEKGCRMGGKYGNFWDRIQKWETGWATFPK